jgi:hypothetical protein
MTTQEQYIGRLKELAEAKYGRTVASAEECALLAAAISEATGMSVDEESLEQLFVESRHGVAPRPNTLSAMAKYVGYDSWIAFCTSKDVIPVEDSDIIPTTRRWGVIILTILALAIVAGAIVYLVVGGSSSTTNREAVVHSVAIDEVCVDVEEQWVASTIELCNTVRIYSGSEEYAMRRDQFIRAYEETLSASIKHDVEVCVVEHGVSFSDEQIAAETERIATRCRTILGGL